MKNTATKNNYRVQIQRATRTSDIPTSAVLRTWALTCLQALVPAGELTIRIVAPEEIRILNATYRHKDYATNILSFRYEDEQEDEIPVLGDLVVCATVVKREAFEQHKAPEAHWAHMIVHGILHLLGHDHEVAHEADIMEAKEIELLKTLQFANPYHKD